jgi:hypothetical protein
MAVVDVFISYSRQDQAKVAMLARMISDEGYKVWWDKDLPPHVSYSDVITAKISEARAAVVVWSKTAVQSEWVRAEADVARSQKKLIQVAADDVIPPLPFNQIQCASLSGWRGEGDHRGWAKIKESLAALCRDGEGAAAAAGKSAAKPHNPATPPRRKPAQAATSPGATKNSNANVIIACGIGGLLAFGLLLWLAMIGSSGSSDIPTDASSAAPLMAVDPKIAPPKSTPELSDSDAQAPPEVAAWEKPANAEAQSEFLIATVMATEGSLMLEVDENMQATGMTVVLPAGETLRTLDQPGVLRFVQRSDGTTGIVEAATLKIVGPE